MLDSMPAMIDPERAFGQDVLMNRTRVRRRRLGAVTLVVLAVAFGAPAAASAFGGADPSASEQRYVVQPGDTLWQVATRLAPQDDPRGVVTRLIETNRLEGATIVPGQVIRLG